MAASTADDGAAVVAGAETEQPEEPQERYSLPILQLVKQAQEQKGLKFKDYARYRQYCARRLHRVRKGCKFTHGRRDYRAKTLKPELVKSSKFLEISLLKAERDWAYAQQLREDMDRKKSEEEDEAPRLRHHMNKKLKRAAQWADELLHLCRAKADARTELEATGYVAFMHATHMLAKDQFAKANELYKQAEKVFQQLAQHSLDPLFKPLCQERAAQMRPFIRYTRKFAQHDQGDTQAPDEGMLNELAGDDMDQMLSSKLQRMLEQDRAQSSQLMADVVWQSTKVTVTNERVRNLLIDAQTKEASLQQELKEGKDADYEKQLASFSAIFTALDDAVQAVRSDIAKEKKGLKGSSSRAVIDNLTLLSEYISHRKLVLTDERNRVMARNLRNTLQAQAEGQKRRFTKRARPEELVTLYERMLQTLDALGESGNQESKNSAEQQLVQAHKAEYTAFRCFYLAWSYQNIDKHAEAYALYSKAAELFGDAAQLSGAGAQYLQGMQDQAKASMRVAHANALIAANPAPQDTQRSATPGGSETGATLLERLDGWDAGVESEQHRLTPFPPQYVAAPGKPILFDLAHNFVEYPSVSHRVPAKAASKPQQSTAPRNGGAKAASKQDKHKKEPEKQADSGSGGGWFGWMRR